jgi:hypothetical protein
MAAGSAETISVSTRRIEMDLIDPNTLTDDAEITAALAYAAEQYVARVIAQRPDRLLTVDERVFVAHVQALLARRRAIRDVLEGS